jgi:endonuclease YncB( thermonuclease family)
MKRKTWQGWAEVDEVIDGDTIKAQIDLGFKIWFKTNIRVAGINAPELPSAPGLKALAFLKTQVRPGDILQVDSKRLDKYGRAEATITLADGRDLATLMLNSGNAQPADAGGVLRPNESQPGHLPGLAPTAAATNTAFK